MGKAGEAVLGCDKEVVVFAVVSLLVEDTVLKSCCFVSSESFPNNNAICEDEVFGLSGNKFKQILLLLYEFCDII